MKLLAQRRLRTANDPACDEICRKWRSVEGVLSVTPSARAHSFAAVPYCAPILLAPALKPERRVSAPVVRSKPSPVRGLLSVLVSMRPAVSSQVFDAHGRLILARDSVEPGKRCVGIMFQDQR